MANVKISDLPLINGSPLIPDSSVFPVVRNNVTYKMTWDQIQNNITASGANPLNITGTGTTNFIPKWTTGGSVIGNSVISDVAGAVTVAGAGDFSVGGAAMINSYNTQFTNGSGNSSANDFGIFNTAASPTVNATNNLGIGFLSGNSAFVVANQVLGAINFFGQANDAGYGAGQIKSVVTIGGNVNRSNHAADLVFSTIPVGEVGLVERMRISSGGLVQVGNGTSQNTFLTTKSLAGWASGIKLTRGLGDGSDISNNNFGMLVTDNGWEVSTFTSPLDNTTGRSAKLVISSGGNATFLNSVDPLVIIGNATANQNANLQLNAGLNGDSYISGTGQGDLIIGNGSAYKNDLSISSAGNVGINQAPASTVKCLIRGIGTTASSVALQVNRGDNSDALTVRDDGRLFYVFTSNGSSVNDVTFNPSTSEVYYVSSSRRYKENIKDYNKSTLDNVLKLKVKTFDYINGNGIDQVGLIAEEVNEHIPELVPKMEVEGFDEPQPNSVRYSQLSVFLLKAIQEQQTLINTLTARIDTLENN